MQIKFDVKLVRFYAMCAASAWSTKCILVHFVFASTLRCLLPDWQYKQKKTQQPTIKGFVIFYLKITAIMDYILDSYENVLDFDSLIPKSDLIESWWLTDKTRASKLPNLQSYLMIFGVICKRLSETTTEDNKTDVIMRLCGLKNPCR